MKRPNVRLSPILKVLVGIVVIFSVLSVLGGRKTMGKSAILRQAQEYLASRYSASFSIVDIDRVYAAGPIPVFHASYHWELTVESDQFPNETFVMRFLQTEEKEWRWIDDYFTLLMREEATNYFAEILQKHLDVPFFVKICWGCTAWPSNTGEGTSIHEWLQAGGEISSIQVFLDNTTLIDDLCYMVAKKILQTESNVHYITFMGISSSGFTSVIHGSDPLDIYQEESSKDWSQSRRVDYGQWQLEEEHQ